jgi:hypothetical protein
MSRVAIPREYSDSTTELMLDSRRTFFGTMTASKDPLRSRGASMVTGPLMVLTVLVVDPLRELPDPRPAGSPFS